MDLSTGIVSGWAKPLFDGSASNWIKLNPTAAGANGAHLVGNEFEGWAFGGANSNDEAIVGLISFNSNTGGGAARYRVLTDFVVPPANEAPEAAISCENPIGTIVPCEIFQGDTIFLVNKSTDDVAITQSRWYSQYGATPYILQNTCVFCNYTPALGLSGAPDFQDYTIKLDVSDGTTTATATKLLRVKRGLNVDFQCSLTEGVGWGSCDDISPMDGDTIYLRDASQPSYSGIISSRIWHLEDSLTDANFGSGAFAPQILFTFPDATVSLNVTDSNGQDGNASHAINGTMRLPTWKEVSPAW